MRAVLAAVLGVLVSASPAPAQTQPWVTLETWVSAIERHQSGRDDDAARAIAEMSAADLEGAFGHMVLLLNVTFVEDEPRGFDRLFKGFAVRIDLSRSDREILTSLAERITKPGLDRFLKRAAALHTDVALFHPDAHLTTREGRGHLTSDGRGEGELSRPWHWMLARDFLYIVWRKTPTDRDVLLWYQAVANYFWSARNFTEGLPHSQKADELFPDDAELQFARGLLHESQAAPQIQAAVAEQQALRAPAPGMVYVPSVGSAASERKEAERAFRKAVALDPSHLEARLRLAHVLTLDGRFDEAATELALVLAGTSHPWHRYFAYLLAGRADEGRGRAADARAAYEAASALFPDAQAPRLAISQIDLRAGDRDGAMKVLAFLSSRRAFDGDPWWQYDAVRTPETEREWLLRVRDAFAKVTR